MKVFAEPPALGEVAHESLSKEGFGPAVRRPLELLVALGHVFEEILHPEQSVLSIRHWKCHPWSGEISGEISPEVPWF